MKWINIYTTETCNFDEKVKHPLSHHYPYDAALMTCGAVGAVWVPVLYLLLAS
jgi:hypothetical protein